MNGITSEAQLRRQLTWLGESWDWILHTKVLDDRRKMATYPKALDVGCGPGLVMEHFTPFLDVKGVDIDPEMVRMARERGMDATVADAMDLPFDDGSFDIAYCSFTLLWVKDPVKALREMARVSKRWVVCFAEPDYAGRICHPGEVAALDPFIVSSLQAEGADPFVARKMARILDAAGLEVEMGVHSGVWSPSQLKIEAKAEWDSILKAVEGRVDAEMIGRAKHAWDLALSDGSLFLYSPIFYAVGRKY